MERGRVGQMGGGQHHSMLVLLGLLGLTGRIHRDLRLTCVCVCVLCRLQICTCVFQCVVCAIKNLTKVLVWGEGGWVWGCAWVLCVCVCFLRGLFIYISTCNVFVLSVCVCVCVCVCV